MNRREFLKRMGVLGGGVIVYFSYGIPMARAQSTRGELPAFNAFLRIGADGRIACYTGKIEMGQGVITSLAQMAADELNAPFDSIDMIMGDTDLCPWDRGTWGSMTTRFFGPKLREAAAEARAVLLEMAAESLKVPLDQLIAENGVIFDSSQSTNRVTYSDLTKGKIMERHLKGKAPLEEATKFTVVGKPFLRSDALDKVTGKAKYAGGHSPARNVVRRNSETSCTRCDVEASGSIRRQTDGGCSRGSRGRSRRRAS